MQRTQTRLLISLWAPALLLFSGYIFDTSGLDPSDLKEFGGYDLGLDSDMELIDSAVRDLPDSGEPDLEDAALPDLADASPADLVDLAPLDLLDMNVVDVPVVDLPPPDMPSLDQSDPDFPVPDMMVPDLMAVDMPTPDMPVPDMMVPDLMAVDMMLPDMLVPDMMLPDQTVLMDTGVGGPCPCSGGLVCIYNACRVKCTRDSCRQAAACASNEACTQQGANLGCLPSLSASAPCQKQPFGCPQGQYCARNISAIYQCLPLCTQSTASCLCTKLSGTTCWVCRN